MSLQETADIMVRFTVSSEYGELPDPKYLESLLAENLFGRYLDYGDSVKIISVGVNDPYFVEEM